ncbi:hypothetical protein L6452_33720 [Arctium lappa]|uniref:Uncharacterized protein n=1 Tax=Arctium lappa TaxID=4217 RepID=A0ACB8YGV9_ARCLA|nr:hypothetical protein L6452_33720 [Arctium lappa]
MLPLSLLLLCALHMEKKSKKSLLRPWTSTQSATAIVAPQVTVKNKSDTLASILENAVLEKRFLKTLILLPTTLPFLPPHVPAIFIASSRYMIKKPTESKQLYLPSPSSRASTSMTSNSFNRTDA